LVGIADAKLYLLDPKSLRATAIAELAGKSASFLSPTDPVRPAHEIVIATTADDGVQTIRTFASSRASKTPPITLAATAHPLLVSQGGLLWQQADQIGPILNETGLAGGASRPLLTLNTRLGAVLWGKTRIIDYRAGDGTPLKGAVILPPDYRPGHRYPTLLWVYEGHRVRAQGEYWLDPQMPGLYNLQLYAARGYVILVPSMPLPGNAQRQDVYSKVAYGVMPAIDALVAMGIADPDRLGVMGQSFGGYSVYALITQSDRFKAAVAMAGVTDIIGFYGQFDPLARGYPGIAHEKSANWVVSEQFGLRTPPAEASAEYWRNSPLAYVDRVRTPLLMIHGEHDIRGPAAQAELFLQSLYAQGKTARLLRYGGESHSLAQSPANVRDALRETIGWFDLYLKPGEGR
jgi:dipeptidyl aminopeptidase/acylaminoacyl peptidase